MLIRNRDHLLIENVASTPTSATARRTEDAFERVFFTSSSQKSTPGLPTRGPLVYRVMRQRWTSCPVPEQ